MQDNTIRLDIDTANGAKEFEKLSKGMDQAQKSSKLLDKATVNLSKGFHTSIGQVSKFTAALGVSTLSITSLIHTAHDLNQKMLDWRRSFNMLSDATGDSSAAIKVWTSAWGESLGSLEEVRSAMMSLNAGGLTVASENFKELTVFVSNFSAATGISADTIGSLMGNMQRYWNVGMQASKSILSAGAAAQKMFNLTTGQVDELYKTIGQAQDKLGAFFVDGAEGAKALARGISVATGALTKMGVSAQTAKSFLDNMVDPENFDKSAVMMRKLGITIEDQINMMESAAGKNNFFDKLLTNLPTLAKEIQSIQNPFARMQYAKNLGMSNEMAAKMAKATEGDMQQILEQYKQVAKEDEAAKEKQQNAAASSAKFGEQLEFLKMQVFMPMMQWVQKMYPYFWKLMQALTKHLSTAMEGTSNLFTSMFNAIKPLYNWITAEESDMKGFAGALSQTMTNVGELMGSLLKKAWDAIKGPMGTFFTTIIMGLPKMLINGIWEFIKSAPWWAQIGVVGFLAIKIFRAFQSFHASVQEFATSVKAQGKKISDAWGGGGTPGRFGQMASKTGQFLSAHGGKMLGGAGGLAAAYGMYEDSQNQAQQNKTLDGAQINRNTSVAGGAASGAMQGVAIGMMFGPLGAAVGAATGGLIGLGKAFFDRNEAEKAFNIQIEKLAKERAKVEGFDLDALAKVSPEAAKFYKEAFKIKANGEKGTGADIKDFMKGVNTDESRQRKDNGNFKDAVGSLNYMGGGNIGGSKSLGASLTTQDKEKLMASDKFTGDINERITQLDKVKDDMFKGLEEKYNIERKKELDLIGEKKENAAKLLELTKKWEEGTLTEVEKGKMQEYKAIVNSLNNQIDASKDTQQAILTDTKNIGAQSASAFLGNITSMKDAIMDFSVADFLAGLMPVGEEAKKKKAKEKEFENYEKTSQKLLTGDVNKMSQTELAMQLQQIKQQSTIVMSGVTSGFVNEVQAHKIDNALDERMKSIEVVLKKSHETAKIGAGHMSSMDKKTPEIKTQNAPDFFSSLVKGYGLLDTNMIIGAGVR